MTIDLKTTDGNDPSATDPVVIRFPNRAGNTYRQIVVSTKTSIILNGGSLICPYCFCIVPRVDRAGHNCRRRQ